MLLLPKLTNAPYSRLRSSTMVTSNTGQNVSNCGTIMVDHCPVEKISEHFFEFVDKVKFQFQLMLHLGMSN